MESGAVLAWFRRAVEAMAAEASGHPNPDLRRRTALISDAMGQASPAPFTATSISAQQVLDQYAERSDPLLREIARLSSALPWTPSMRLDDGGTSVGLVDLGTCIDMPVAGAGLMLVGSGVAYPEHRHDPAEVYLILQGSRNWRFGGAEDYVRVDAGSVLTNNPNDLHGVEAGDDVLLALWVLIDES